jgi:pimeloyl-ACP methyl ester carboxylesterase
MAALSATSRLVPAWDGLALHVREWMAPGADPQRPPLLCLPGLVRTGGDFAGLAARHAGRRRVVAVEFAGRGRSGRAAKVARYAPEACLRDLLDLCAALHIHRAVVVGTSFGGLLAMALGAARPTLLQAVVLNDIGPEIGSAGAEMVRDFVALDPALPGLGEAASFLRERLPDLSFADEAQWRDFAALTYAPAADGRWRPLWDTRIAQLLGGAVPDLWPFFGALAAVPLMLVQGGRSTILEEGTVARMRAARPDMAVVRLDAVGHAPSLAEPGCAPALDAFLEAA